jgi:hypothetical protein
LSYKVLLVEEIGIPGENKPSHGQDLSNPDFKQDFDYEKYDLSHIQSNNSSLFVMDSIITSDAMKAANSIGIASVNPLCSGFCI